jgi:hypothetical protein
MIELLVVINAVDYEMPGADGHDIVVGVKEQRMDEFDIDLLSELCLRRWVLLTHSNHATVMFFNYWRSR